MLYFVCGTWEELLHSFQWILHVPFPADSFFLWGGGQIHEILPLWLGVLWGTKAWRKDKFTSVPEAQVRLLVWAALLALLRAWCVLPAPGHGDWALVSLGSRDGAEPGAGLLLAAPSPCQLGIILRVQYWNSGSVLGCARPRCELFHWGLLCLSSSSPFLVWLYHLPLWHSSSLGCDGWGGSSPSLS